MTQFRNRLAAVVLAVAGLATASALPAGAQVIYEDEPFYDSDDLVEYDATPVQPYYGAPVYGAPVYGAPGFYGNKEAMKRYWRRQKEAQKRAFKQGYYAQPNIYAQPRVAPQPRIHARPPVYAQPRIAPQPQYGGGYGGGRRIFVPHSYGGGTPLSGYGAGGGGGQDARMNAGP